MWDSLLAVIATLAGVTLTFTFQRRTAREAREAARHDQLDSERRTALTALASRLVQYREAQIARVRSRLQNGTDAAELVAAVRNARQDAWSAYFSVALILPDDAILSRAGECFDLTHDLNLQTSPAELDQSAGQLRAAIDTLVRAASTTISATRALPRT
jgi:hypothetical protein